MTDKERKVLTKWLKKYERDYVKYRKTSDRGNPEDMFWLGFRSGMIESLSGILDGEFK